MDLIGRGIIAGFMATLILSSVFHPIARFANASDATNPAVGWLVHFLVGTFLWGAGYGAVQRFLPGANWMRGAIFSLTAWLVLMTALAPLTRAGLFGVNIGLGAPAVMLGVHLAYGLLLGVIFGLLDPEPQHPHEEEEAHDEHWRPVAR
ncbi:hypothetical protein GJW-30_1_00611 [Variibacter gotjawalensis]|uniref:Uncharacterized protein n=1 Tax=Variibacter gotjawalensis TaxID=1333996 RepID=A0A0S3PQF4_9BRAD|nr:DUF6789 family protein [Variibacter gotjawalensis]NIK48396.1 hypothetical protein [Variibacter gotjawalensis]RZS50263.1 hypothetical protein EV661_2719 [Variibacter gotjawalensis]BAT58096.1 hypothetical protein GJW-30_1_00611 [Variibacter gotjawalensis]